MEESTAALWVSDGEEGRQAPRNRRNGIFGVSGKSICKLGVPVTVLVICALLGLATLSLWKVVPRQPGHRRRINGGSGDSVDPRGVNDIEVLVPPRTHAPIGIPAVAAFSRSPSSPTRRETRSRSGRRITRKARLLKAAQNQNGTMVPTPCNTDHCRDQSDYLRQTVNFAVDPCNDFFDYVCGNYWVHPDGPYAQIEETIRNATIAALSAARVPNWNQNAFQKAAALYQSCFAFAESYRNEREQLKALMVRVNLDLLNLAGSRTVDSVNAVARLSLDVGFPVMFEFKLFDEYFVEGKRAMQFKICDSRTAWEKKREKLRSPVRVRGYISDQLLYYPGYDPENQKHKELTNTTYGYDEAFVAILKTDRYITEPFYTRAIQDMGLRTTPQITAAQWIDAVSKYTNGTYEGPDVIQFQQSVLQALAGLLRSPLWGPDGFRAMLAWGLFDGLLDYALSPKVVFGKEKEVACYHHVLEVMEFAATSRYLRSVVSSRARSRAEGMFLTAKDTVRGVLDLYDGFQETERVFVQRIVHFMNPLVSSPQQRLDQIFVNKFFVTLEAHLLPHAADTAPLTARAAGFPDMSPTGRFLDAWFKALSGRARLKWTDQTHVLFNTSRAAPFYLKRNHSLVIPAGALLPISLYGDGHPALTLGSLGDALVHEIMKAYDIKGPYQCYSDRTRRRYTELVECLAQQRQQAGLPGRPNGSQLIDLENVADLAGASLLDKLFWQLHDDERSWTLPNLNLTAEQLVYVGRCMTKCNFNDFAQTETLEGSRARCNIPAMNTPQFSRAFNCGPTARMNPELKCTHWL